MAESEIVVLPSGVSIRCLGRQAYDWPSIKVLAERGVPFSTIAEHFNGLDKGIIATRSHADGWLTPVRERKMQKELLARQRAALLAQGEVEDPEAVIAKIWEDRQSRVDEKAFALVEDALDGADSRQIGRGLIEDAKDLKTVVEVARKVTGAEKRDQEDLAQGPSLAINVGFLRSAVSPAATIDV